MPEEDKAPAELVENVFGRALGPKKYRGMRKAAEKHVEDLNKVHSGSYNRVAYEQTVELASKKSDPTYDLFSFAIHVKPTKPVPASATVPISDYDKTNFLERARQFKFASFLPRPEVIDALIKARGDCNRIAGTSLFSTKIPKSVRLEEFEQIQIQNVTMEMQNIKER